MISTRALLCCLAAAPVAAALSGCSAAGSVSTSAFTGAKLAVAQTVSNFVSDAGSHNTTKLCDDDLASNLVKALAAGGRSCSTVMTNQLNEVDDFTLTIESIAVDGDTATAAVKDIDAGKDHTNTLRLVKKGGSWKISGLA